VNKRDYFVDSLKQKRYIYKQWVLECFSVVRSNTGKLPSFIQRDGNMKPFAWVLTPEGERVELALDDSEVNITLFDAQDELTLMPGDLPNIKSKVETTYGVALLNAIALCYAFEDKIEYINDDPIQGSTLDGLVISRLSDYPPKGQEKDPTKIYVDELLKYLEGCSALGGFGCLFSPTASPKTMTINPAIIKRRDELFTKHKDELNNPVILAAIDKELTDMLRAELMQDSSAAFFIDAKAIDVSMKKTMISYGLELGFDSENPSFIPKSLAEGFDVKNMAAIADSSRAGSYSRGTMTALAGQSVKDLYRVFQNTKIVEEDCQSKLGLSFYVTKSIAKQFVGRYLLTGNTIQVIDDAMTKELIGKTITIRSPYRCLSKPPYFCARCLGDRSALSPTGIPTEISDIGSAFMYAEMKAMHGKSLSTTKFNLAEALS